MDLNPKPRACDLDVNKGNKDADGDEKTHKEATAAKKAAIQQEKNNMQQSKNRRRFELMQNLKYTLVFDELVDDEELQKLFGQEQTNNC